ncbi:MAG: glycosyltransferase [Elusimicrobia bacterium]|nr:glycosyltransferase [Elusimicrobiota bacterium]
MPTTFHVITPCRNAEPRLRETVESVLSQTAVVSGRARLSYTVVDGASTDRSAEVVRGFGSDRIRWISEPDAGMYDALAKGLRLARPPGVCCYINAGDLYAKGAFDVVLDLFEKKAARWLTGMRVSYNDRSQVVSASLPFRYHRSLIEAGLYGRCLPFIQQESTFWDASLNDRLDLGKLAGFKLAGDFYLWKTFAEVSDLAIVEAFLGGFRVHPGQLSEARARYLAELDAIARAPSLAERLLAQAERGLWHAPGRVKKWFNPKGLYRFDHGAQDWR